MQIWEPRLQQHLSRSREEGRSHPRSLQAPSVLKAWAQVVASLRSVTLYVKPHVGI